MAALILKKVNKTVYLLAELIYHFFAHESFALYLPSLWKSKVVQDGFTLASSCSSIE